jgi:hypothetical protein
VRDGATSQLRAYPADGCGAATCDPIATFDLEGLAYEVAVSGGQVFVSTSVGTNAFGLPA